ncbi:pyruvate kinase [Candidatus Ichthyocystis hellenicum]|uniref:pyruvate kinase n=1 Tax=Candidatus Ichthyocystis hellenicum TaxID=1561003 RepID=UPI000B864CF6
MVFQTVLKEQQIFTLDANPNSHLGNESQVHIGYPQLPQEVSVGNMLVLDDGRITVYVYSTAVDENLWWKRTLDCQD